MTLTEAITHAKEKAKELRDRNCIDCAVEHEQLAAWLEELSNFQRISLYRVKRPEDTVTVTIMLCEADMLYHFVNLTKGHICKCGFLTMEDALADMETLKNEGRITTWMPLPEPYTPTGKDDSNNGV